MCVRNTECRAPLNVDRERYNHNAVYALHNRIHAHLVMAVDTLRTMIIQAKVCERAV